ncbi:HNH endonuclease [Arthrobacter phage Nitro]|uniref:HNH endonuclease n=1 Tax=Arthrobacter phage Nitro TaxID=3077792 RepID=A0AA96HE02_9CAUD|nr:HNH endonuclease [Arthrobacter phage Nitro]
MVEEVTCCKECAYPGNPGVCVKAGTCPCHDTEDDPLAQRLAAIAARYADDPEDAEALTREALSRLAQRRKRSGKKCDRCREFKPMSAFSKDSSRPDGLMRYCRACRSAAYRAGLV